MQAMKTRLNTLLLILLFLPLTSLAQGNIHFRQFSTAGGLPNAMMHQVRQDDDGFLWIATFHGLYRYDGYELRPFKSDMLHPNLLWSNNVVSIANDSRRHRLWTGTNDGLCALDLYSYNMRKYRVHGLDKQRINNICVTRRGEVFVASIRGLLKYDDKLDSVMPVGKGDCRGEIPGRIDVQAVCEDNGGDIIIATWSDGLYRYERLRNRFIHYKNMMAPCHFVALYPDSEGRIWAGTLGKGAMLLTFSKDKQSVTVRQFAHAGNSSIVSDYVYSFCERRKDKSLWIATRDGISIMRKNGGGQFRNIIKGGADGQLPASQIRNLFEDRSGNMWACTQGGGLLIAESGNRPFDNRLLTSNADQPDLVSTIFVEKNGAVWTGQWYGVTYRHGSVTTTIMPDKRPQYISKSQRTGHVYIAFHDGGLAECKDGKVLHVYMPDNCRFIPNTTVKMAIEDRKGNLWVATYQGLGVRYADGRQFCLKDVFRNVPALHDETTSICIDDDGSLWLTTESSGIVHLYGDMNNPRKMTCRIYNKENGKLPINTPQCLYADHEGRLWAGTDGFGLCLYDKHDDSFRSVHQSYNLPGDMVGSIEEDRFGTLWIGTNEGVSRLSIRRDGIFTQRTFTTADGLADNFFGQNSSCRQGDMLYFGCSRGYVSFHATNVVAHSNNVLPAFTGILMNGDEMADVAANHLERLTIPASVKDFTISFSALNFSSSRLCSYAWRLRGYDKTWHYSKSDSREATYANLSPGTYTFELKATDADGNWSKTKTMTVVVEPPVWRTWWAYLIYTLLVIAIIIKCVKEIRRRMMLRNKLVLQVSGDKAQTVIDHEGSKDKDIDDKKKIALEIKDLNFTNEDEMFLKNAIKCVNDHLDDADFDVPQFEREMLMSHSSMFKRLKTLTGMSATAFIKDIRLKVAWRELSKNPAVRISDLAYSVGFNDPKYFSACFKKQFGFSPTEFGTRNRA